MNKLLDGSVTAEFSYLGTLSQLHQEAVTPHTYITVKIATKSSTDAANFVPVVKINCFYG
jgi:hypothetical protein